MFFSTSLGIALIPRLQSNVATDVKRSNYVDRYLKLIQFHLLTVDIYSVKMVVVIWLRLPAAQGTKGCSYLNLLDSGQRNTLEKEQGLLFKELLNELTTVINCFIMGIT